MKFIILVSNLKEISPSVFSGKKEYIKKTTMQFYRQNTIRPKIMLTVYVLKNGVGWYNIFFFIFTRNPHVCVVFVQNPSIFLFVPYMCFSFRKQFRTCANSLPNRFTEYMNSVRVNIEFFNGYKKIKKRRISFVLDYLRTI